MFRSELSAAKTLVERIKEILVQSIPDFKVRRFRGLEEEPLSLITDLYSVYCPFGRKKFVQGHYHSCKP